MFSCTTTCEKYVLGSRLAGLFSNIFAVINHLVWCKKENKDLVIYWCNKKCFYGVPYGYNGSKNIWEYYFEPLSENIYQKKDIIHYDYYAPDGQGIDIDFKNYHKNFSYEYRSFINTYFEKYVHIKPTIIQKINDFYQKNIARKKTVGIHVRRTDHNQETPHINLLRYIEAARKFKNFQFFVATDDERVLNFFKHYLSAPVLYYDSFRSIDDTALHKFNNHVTNRALMGEQVLIEAKLLSMCDVLIHSVSNVSLAALFFNPLLKNIYLDPYQE
jgi:hypothetical protein